MPYTADNARRNAWDAYHDWVNKGYGIADKITAKEREIQDLEEQLAELENRIGKEVRSGRRRPAKSFVGAAGSSTADNDTNTGEDNSDAVNNQNGTENTDGDGNADTGTNTDAADSTENESENANTDDTDSTENENENANTDDKDSVENGNENTETGALAPDTKDNQNPSPADEEKRTELLNKIKKANEELLALRDQLTKHDRDAVTQPDYSAEEAEYDAWQNTKLTLEETVQQAKESYNDASYTREVTLRQKLRRLRMQRPPQGQTPPLRSMNWISNRRRNKWKDFRKSDSKREKSRQSRMVLFQNPNRSWRTDIRHRGTSADRCTQDPASLNSASPKKRESMCT